MSHGQPARWTQRMARVRSLKVGAMVAALMFCETGSTSAKTGRAPRMATQLADAMKLRGVTTTSSPVPMPSACSAASSATVPFAIATAYREFAGCRELALEGAALVPGPVVDPPGAQHGHRRPDLVRLEARPAGPYFHRFHGRGGDVRLGGLLVAYLLEHHAASASSFFAVAA